MYFILQNRQKNFEFDSLGNNIVKTLHKIIFEQKPLNFNKKKLELKAFIFKQDLYNNEINFSVFRLEKLFIQIVV